MSDDRLLTIPQAAEVLGKSQTYVRDRINDGTLDAMNRGKGERRRKMKIAESSVMEHKKMLDKQEKERASRRRKPKTECLPAAQVEMFSGPGVGDLLDELKKTNEMLGEIAKDVAAIQSEGEHERV